MCGVLVLAILEQISTGLRFALMPVVLLAVLAIWGVAIWRMRRYRSTRWLAEANRSRVCPFCAYLLPADDAADDHCPECGARCPQEGLAEYWRVLGSGRGLEREEPLLQRCGIEPPGQTKA
jgi:hypothetical protein